MWGNDSVFLQEHTPHFVHRLGIGQDVDVQALLHLFFHETAQMSVQADLLFFVFQVFIL